LTLALGIAAQEPPPVQRVQTLFQQQKFEEGAKLTVELAKAMESSGKRKGAAEFATMVGKFLQAQQLSALAVGPFREALRIQRAIQGAGPNADVASALVLLGEALPPKESIAPYEEALGMRVALVGESDAGAAEIHHNLAVSLRQMGQYQKALPHAQKSLAIIRVALKGDHVHVAYCLQCMADCQQALGNHAEAIRYHNEAVAMQHRIHPPTSPQPAIADARFANYLLSIGRAKEAEALLAKASRALRMRLGKSHRTTLWAKYHLGLARMELGEFESARSLFEEGLRPEVRAGTAPHDQAWRLFQLAQALWRLSRIDEALTRLSEAEELCGKRAPQASLRADIRTTRSQCFATQREFERSLVEANAALALRREHGLAESSVALDTCGWALQELGRPVEALAYHKRAVAQARRVTPGGSWEEAVSTGNLAGALFKLGRTEEALRLSRDAVGVQRRLLGPDHVRVSIAELVLAGRIQDSGRPYESLALLEDALKGLRRGFPNGSIQTIRCLNRLALCCLQLGQFERARACCADAYLLLGTIKATEKEHLASLRMLVRILVPVDPRSGVVRSVEMIALAGRLYGDVSDEYRRAREAHVRVLAAAGRWKECEALCRELLNAGSGTTVRHTYCQALWRRGERDEAIAEARKVVKEWGAFGGRAGGLLAGMLLLNGADPREPIRLLRAAIAGMESEWEEARGLTFGERAQYRAFLSLGWEPYHTLAYAYLRAERADDALAAVERGRARGLLDLLERSRFDAFAESERRARAAGDQAALARITGARRELLEAEQDLARIDTILQVFRARPEPPRDRVEKLVVGRAAARERLRKARRTRAAVTADMVPLTAPASVETLQRMIGKREALLVYSVGVHRSMIFLARRSGEVRGFELRHDGKNLSQQTLAASIDSSLPGFSGRRARGMRTAGQATPTKRNIALFRALLPANVWKEIRDLERVYIVPHGALHRLPFDLLNVDADRRWIDVGPAIAYVPSGSVLKWCRRRHDEALRIQPAHRLFAVGDARFAGLEQLPGTRQEVEAIRKALGEGVEVRLGEEARERAVFDGAPKSRVLHIASHQVLDESEGASFSYIALSRPKDAGAEDDGKLHLYELIERWGDRLAACDLVVLSACDTQRGKSHADEAVHAMPVGFMYAGASSVIATLWPVDDESAAELFADFYQRLAKGTPKLQAFTEARKALKKKYPDPYHWAPFVYIGDPR